MFFCYDELHIIPLDTRFGELYSDIHQQLNDFYCDTNISSTFINCLNISIKLERYIKNHYKFLKFYNIEFNFIPYPGKEHVYYLYMNRSLLHRFVYA